MIRGALEGAAREYMVASHADCSCSCTHRGASSIDVALCSIFHDDVALCCMYTYNTTRGKRILRTLFGSSGCAVVVRSDLHSCKS